MRLAVMQPYFFPYFGYYQLLHSVDRFVFLDDVRFIKQGWINRNRILNAGEVIYLTVPVRSPGLRGRICDIEPQGDWRRKCLETIRHSYRRQPGFEEIFPVVERVLSTEPASIGELARSSVTALAEVLGVACSFIESSRVYCNDDLRGHTRVLDIATREGADTYVNLPGGRDLYDARDFERAGIELRFLEPESFPYPQASAEFVPRLSALDLLMSLGARQARERLSAYTLAP